MVKGLTINPSNCILIFKFILRMNRFHKIKLLFISKSPPRLNATLCVRKMHESVGEIYLQSRVAYDIINRKCLLYKFVWVSTYFPAPYRMKTRIYQGKLIFCLYPRSKSKIDRLIWGMLCCALKDCDHQHYWQELDSNKRTMAMRDETSLC